MDITITGTNITMATIADGTTIVIHTGKSTITGNIEIIQI
ncbi:hypothetical protein SDC9_194367 [bioreactor metagenome]|uniref:Uncharacterized protein n=1 Tax=bioreactor metagenome TaxID=1076179 RepID=A0A645I8P2_9ZZZZ